MSYIVVNSLDSMYEYLDEYENISFPEKTDVIFTGDFTEGVFNCITVNGDLYIGNEYLGEEKETIIYGYLEVKGNIIAYNHLHVEFSLYANNINSTSSIYVRKGNINCNTIKAKRIYASRGIKAKYIENTKNIGLLVKYK